jgi:four helix bundle protein
MQRIAEELMSTPQEELRERTKQFAYRVIRLFRSLPRTPEAQVIGKQLLRSATAVAANYRATNRSRSQPDFVSKISIVLEEADETLFWLECLRDNGIIRPDLLADICTEAEELVCIFSASRETARSHGHKN